MVRRVVDPAFLFHLAYIDIEPNFFTFILFLLSLQLPALEVDSETIIESNAIAYYYANEQLRGGSNEVQQAQVIQWLSYADNEILPPLASWVFPKLGFIQVDKGVEEAGKAELLELLGQLNNYLLTRTWLVGERLTLADIVVGSTLLKAYDTVLDPQNRASIPNVNRWFTTFINQKEVKAVVGEVKLNEKEGVTTAKPVVAGASGDKKEKKKEEKKKEEKKKEQKKEAEPEDEGDAADDILKEEKPAKDPFEQFPKGNFNMDDFKRFYSNNDELKAVEYFWSKFDKEHYSIWLGEYKYPEELTLVFMSCNLMSGMMQRLDRMRKNAFGSLLLFGEDYKSSISQLWIWRGHELAFKLSPDWEVDYESYNWRKIDPDTDEAKTLVKEYFTWEGDFGGRKFNQGKIFK